MQVIRKPTSIDLLWIKELLCYSPVQPFSHTRSFQSSLILLFGKSSSLLFKEGTPYASEAPFRLHAKTLLGLHFVNQLTKGAIYSAYLVPTSVGRLSERRRCVESRLLSRHPLGVQNTQLPSPAAVNWRCVQLSLERECHRPPTTAMV